MSPLNVQYAVACLGQLQQHSQSQQSIAHEAGIPNDICADILARFEYAGIIRRHGDGVVELRSALPSSLEVLEVLWGAAPPPAFKPLYAHSRGASHWMKLWTKKEIANG